MFSNIWFQICNFSLYVRVVIQGFIRLLDNLKTVFCRSCLKTFDIVCGHFTLKKKGIKVRSSQLNLPSGSSAEHLKKRARETLVFLNKRFSFRTNLMSQQFCPNLINSEFFMLHEILGTSIVLFLQMKRLNVITSPQSPFFNF